MEDKELIKVLGEALQEAADHLDYCGYGDSWERECAVDNGVTERIDKAVAIYSEYREKEEKK
jgi:hypothetical protein